MDPATLVEYEKLKDEQTARITARDSLLNFNLVALAALVTIGVSLRSATVVLLFAPWISAIFGWAYVQHEQKITAIGRYIKDTNGSVFNWESLNKQVVLDKRFHSAISLAMLMLAFAAPCFTAPLMWFARSPSFDLGLIIVALLDFCLGLSIVVVLVASIGR
jgi:hypothetical protein